MSGGVRVRGQVLLRRDSPSGGGGYMRAAVSPYLFHSTFKTSTGTHFVAFMLLRDIRSIRKQSKRIGQQPSHD